MKLYVDLKTFIKTCSNYCVFGCLTSWKISTGITSWYFDLNRLRVFERPATILIYTQHNRSAFTGRIQLCAFLKTTSTPVESLVLLNSLKAVHYESKTVKRRTPIIWNCSVSVKVQTFNVSSNSVKGKLNIMLMHPQSNWIKAEKSFN